jgi:hypothetical protein
MAAAILERLSGTSPAAATTLAQLRLPFGAGRAATLPRVAICVLGFAHTPVLLANAASRECIASALHLLVNLSHNTAAGDVVVGSGGIEALATALLRISTTVPDDATTTAEQKDVDAGVAPLLCSQYVL